MTKIRPVAIKLSRWKLAAMAAWGWLLCGQLAWVFVDNLDGLNLTVILLPVVIVAFTIYAFRLSRKLFDQSPGFCITEDGFIDNSRLGSKADILWSDVLHIKGAKSSPGQNLIVALAPDESQLRPANIHQRLVQSICRRVMGSSVLVRAEYLAIGQTELNALFKRKFRQSRRVYREALRRCETARPPMAEGV